MAAGGADAPPPLPSSSGGHIGSSFSEENFQIFEECMRDPGWRRLLLGSINGDETCKIGQRIARLVEEGKSFHDAVMQIGAQLAAGHHGVPVIRDLVEWVKSVMFPIPGDIGSGLDVSCIVGGAALDTCCADAGGDEQSKRIKIEALAIVGNDPSPSQVRPITTGGSSKGMRSSVVDPIDLGGEVFKPRNVDGSRIMQVCPLPICGNASEVEMGSEIAGSGVEPNDVAVDKILQMRRPPICGNASENAAVDNMDNGSKISENLSLVVTCHEEKSLEVAAGGIPCSLGTNDVVLEVSHAQAFEEGVGLADEPFAPVSDLLVLDSIRRSHTKSAGSGSHPASVNALENAAMADGFVQSQVHAARGLAVVEDVERSLEKDFLPPDPGMQLSEWIKMADKSRPGRMKGHISGALARGVPLRSKVPESSADHFPPLTGGGKGSAVASGPIPPLPRCGIGGRSSNSVAAGLSDCAARKQDGGNKFSWKDLLRSNKPVDMGVDLHFVAPQILDGEPCEVFSVEEEEENMVNWHHTLLCYVMGKSPSYYQFSKAVNRMWNPSGGVEVFSRENGLFYCRFSCEEDLCRVIKDGPWYMDGKLVVVKKFMGTTNCEEEMLSCIPIWVKLPCLPVQWWSSSGVSKVVSTFGHPLYFDVPSASQSRIAYARCCVEVAMDKDLPEFVTCVGGDKVKRRQQISYDWVPKKCKNCMTFGHLAMDCGKELNKDGAKGNKEAEQGRYKRDGQQGNAINTKSVIEEPRGVGSKEDNAGGALQKNLMQGQKNKVSSTNAFHPLLCTEEETIDDMLGNEPKDTDDGPQHVSGDEEDGDNASDRNERDRVSCSSKGDPIVMGCVDVFPPSPSNKVVLELEGNEDGTLVGGDPAYHPITESSKKAKRVKKRPAPIRPEGSRVTRHSGRMPLM